MATQLKNIVRFTNVAAGATVALPHGLAWSPPGGGEIPQIPDILIPDRGGFLITGDATNVTVTNTTAAPRSLDVLAEKWHTMERDFGAASIENLVPRPFVLNLGDTGVPDDSGVLGFGSRYLTMIDTEGTEASPDNIFPWYDNSIDLPDDVLPVPAPRAGTLRNLFVHHNVGLPDENPVTYTVFLNGVPTLLTATVLGGGADIASNLVNSVVVAQGDLVAMVAEHGVLPETGQTELTEVEVTATMVFED